MTATVDAMQIFVNPNQLLSPFSFLLFPAMGGSVAAVFAAATVLHTVTGC